MGKMISTSEFASKLGVSAERIRQLCKGGRIANAKLLTVGTSSVWLIPDEAIDPRLKHGRPKDNESSIKTRVSKKRISEKISVPHNGSHISSNNFSNKHCGLRDPKWGLAWSNPNIDDDVLIRKALFTAGFTKILQACLDFGVDEVVRQWSISIKNSEFSEIRIKNLVSDILKNITEGFSHAKT